MSLLPPYCAMKNLNPLLLSNCVPLLIKYPFSTYHFFPPDPAPGNSYSFYFYEIKFFSSHILVTTCATCLSVPNISFNMLSPIPSVLLKDTLFAN